MGAEVELVRACDVESHESLGLFDLSPGGGEGWRPARLASMLG